MAGEPFVIQLELDNPLSEVLGRAMVQTDDLSSPMEEVATHLESASRLRFETSTGPDGTPWTQSAAAKARGGKTLVDSTDLKTSMTSDFGPTYAEAGAERSFGAAIYAKVHQLGIDQKVQVPAHQRRITEAFGVQLAKEIIAKVKAHLRHMKLPARPYVGFGKDDREAILEIFTRFVGGLFSAAPAPSGDPK